MEFKDKKIAVVGLGMEGKSVVRHLQNKGLDVTVFDRKDEKDLDFTGIKKSKIKLVCGENYLASGLTSYDVIFRSQGVNIHLPQIVEAQKSGIELTSEIKLFFDMCPAKIIGVTGTKGKGTTSTLIYEIVKESGHDAYLAGNIGAPRLDLLPKLKRDSWVVLELSSTQLIDLHKSPHVGVVLNITTDHLDWHKDRKEYVAAKESIVRYQAKSDFAVINSDYEDSKSFSKLTPAKKYYFSKLKRVKGCFVKNNKIILSAFSKDVSVGVVNDLLLRGEHNWENICAAVCAASLAGASLKGVKKIVFSFTGLEHRLELVRRVRGVTFYDDSFSTNPQTTMAAVNSFDEPTTIILGGFDKGLNYDEMASVMAKKENIKHCILIGDISETIKNSLIKNNFKNEILELGYLSMERIVRKCFEVTPKGGVVLLSPASSSFDMFENYKERGNLFKEEVERLNLLQKIHEE